jgi:hypothetical protein
VLLTKLAKTSYAENGGGPPEGVSLVFVRILSVRLRDQEALAL